MSCELGGTRKLPRLLRCSFPKLVNRLSAYPFGLSARPRAECVGRCAPPRPGGLAPWLPVCLPSLSPRQKTPTIVSPLPLRVVPGCLPAEKTKNSAPTQHQRNTKRAPYARVPTEPRPPGSLRCRPAPPWQAWPWFRSLLTLPFCACLAGFAFLLFRDLFY